VITSLESEGKNEKERIMKGQRGLAYTNDNDQWK